MRSFTFITSPGLCVLLPLTLAQLACTTGQTGGEVDVGRGNGDFESDSQCVEREREDLDPKTMTDLGVSAEQLISIIEGRHESTLVWSPRTLDEVAVEPEASTQGITLEISVDEDALSYVRQKSGRERDEGSDAEDLALEDPCGDFIEIIADVRVQSDNGAFNDTFTTVFRGASEAFVRGSIPLQPQELSGSFKVDLDKNTKLYGTALSISFALGTLSGRIAGGLEVERGNAVSGAAMEYGYFPEEACEWGAFIDRTGEWAQELQEELDQAKSFDWSWQEGDDTTLTLASEIQSLCFEPRTSWNEDIVAATLKTQAQTEDGQINGTWELSAGVTLDVDGTIRVVNIYRDAYLRDTFTQDDFQSRTGISTQSAAEQLSFQFGYTIDLTDDLQATGSFAVFEISDEGCSDQETTQNPDKQPSDSQNPLPKTSGDSASGDELPPDGGSEPDGSRGSPGCAGSDLVERDIASFVEN